MPGYARDPLLRNPPTLESILKSKRQGIVMTKSFSITRQVATSTNQEISNKVAIATREGEPVFSNTIEHPSDPFFSEFTPSRSSIQQPSIASQDQPETEDMAAPFVFVAGSQPAEGLPTLSEEDQMRIYQRMFEGMESQSRHPQVTERDITAMMLERFKSTLSSMDMKSHTELVRTVNEHYVNRRIGSAGISCSPEAIYNDILGPSLHIAMPQTHAHSKSASVASKADDTNNMDESINNTLASVDAALIRNGRSWQAAVGIAKSMNAQTSDPLLSDPCSDYGMPSAEEIGAAMAAVGTHVRCDPYLCSGQSYTSATFHPCAAHAGSHEAGSHAVRRPIIQPRRRVLPDRVIVERGGGIELTAEELAALQKEVVGGPEFGNAKRDIKRGKSKGKKN